MGNSSGPHSRRTFIARCKSLSIYAAGMSPTGFAILCLLSFTLPVPLLAWLDRARR